MVRVWSRLLAVVQHGLVIGSIGGQAEKSLSKAYEAVRDFAGRLGAALLHPSDLERVLDDRNPGEDLPQRPTLQTRNL